MGEDNPVGDKKVVVLVVDMQDNMWNGDGDVYEKLAQKRMQAMGMLAEDIDTFTNDMRANGAQIVWVLLDNDELSNYGDLAFNLHRQEGDLEIHKTGQSPLPENIEFFEGLKEQADLNAQFLDVKVCGVWALECVANTAVTLHEGGYNVRVVGDLILDSGKPCMDDDRPDFREAHALHVMGEATGIGPEISEWSYEVVSEQKVIASISSQDIKDDPEP